MLTSYEKLKNRKKPRRHFAFFSLGYFYFIFKNRTTSAQFFSILLQLHHVTITHCHWTIFINIILQVLDFGCGTGETTVALAEGWLGNLGRPAEVLKCRLCTFFLIEGKIPNCRH